MTLYISHDFFHYEAGNLCRLFFPYEELKLINNKNEAHGLAVTAEITDNQTYVAAVTNGETTVQKTVVSDKSDEAEYHMMRALFGCLSEFCGYKPKWGLLTGIHPVKLYTQYVKKQGAAEADRIFSQDFFVSEDKISLCRRIYKAQDPSIRALMDDDFSLYISIPFCPSRCAYCSFVSQSVEKQEKLIEPYVLKLLDELKDTARIVRETGLRMVSAYIGGGTPTTLNPDQLIRVISAVKENFDMSSCGEFTVEAGRPDTIDSGKMAALKSMGVTRISVNPQSLDDNVLKNIGRRHTAKEAIDAFYLARESGFDNINMDLIAGLQGDTAQSFERTVNQVIEMNPESVTVHSLALKRSAEIFHKEGTKDFHRERELVSSMVEYSIKKLTEAGYEPYYLYRQSRMAGNQENTGWAKKGCACRYNIYTMDETHTVIACGAGGVSKIKDPYSDRLERIFNFKYSYEYISRFDEMIGRKEGVKVLYEQFRKRVH